MNLPHRSYLTNLISMFISFSTIALNLLNTSNTLDFIVKKYTEVFPEKISYEGNKIHFPTKRLKGNRSTKICVNPYELFLCAILNSPRKWGPHMLLKHTLFTKFLFKLHRWESTHHLFLNQLGQPAKMQMAKPQMPYHCFIIHVKFQTPLLDYLQV